MCERKHRVPPDADGPEIQHVQASALRVKFAVDWSLDAAFAFMSRCRTGFTIPHKRLRAAALHIHNRHLKPSSQCFWPEGVERCQRTPLGEKQVAAMTELIGPAEIH